VQDIFQFDPVQWWNVLDQLICLFGESLFNTATLGFLKTGRFRFWLPFMANVEHYDRAAPSSMDWIGLNYYSHFTISAVHVMLEPDPEQKLQAPSTRCFVFDDMNHPMYAEGFYRALQQVGELSCPVYVAENGISDAQDDRRALFLRRYLYALAKAMHDGVADVRGYFYWTLLDNFEWAEGFLQHFGLFEVDMRSPYKERKLRAGSHFFVDLVRTCHASPLCA